MPNAHDLIGRQFLWLSVEAEAESRFTPNGTRRRMYRCRCGCGREVVVEQQALLIGRRQSCGCRRGLAFGGKRGHPLYLTWRKMIERCYSPSCPSFDDYGGRGITVCQRWLRGDVEQTGFEYFVNDMGPKPTAEHSIERKDNNSGYQPGNCIWATRVTQACNKRNNVILDLTGGGSRWRPGPMNAALTKRFFEPASRLVGRPNGRLLSARGDT